MNFKRSYLALAVAAALGSSNAFAVVDLEDSDTAMTYGSETIVDDSNPTGGFVNTAGSLNFSHTLKTSMSAETDYYLRYELEGGATWPTGMAGSVLTLACSTTITASSIEYRDSGQTLLFGLTIPASQSCSNNHVATVAMPDPAFAAGDLPSQATLSINYRSYDIQSIANQGNTSGLGFLAGIDGGEYLNFDKSFLESDTATVATSVIDVADNSLSFETSSGDSDTTAICGYSLDEADGVYAPNEAEPATNGGVSEIISSADLVISGDFSAADSVYRSNNSDCSGTVVGTATVDAANGTATFDMANGDTSGSFQYVCMDVDGTNEIQPSVYSAQYQPTAATGYNVGNINYGECGEITRGGSSAHIVLVLNPTGTYTQYIRITNPSSITGNVHITAYDDAGTKGTNTWTFELAAGASTGLITPAMISSNTGLSPVGGAATVGAGNLDKLRAVVSAEFGTDGEATAVQVRSYTLSTSGDVFNYFQ